MVGGLPILQGCGNAVDVAPYIEATVDADVNSSHYGQVEVVVGRYPELQRVGGAVTVRIAQPTGTHPFVVPEDGLLLIHLRDEIQLFHGGEESPTNQFVAADSACPHAGCPLGYNPGSGLIECPCHSSRFRPVADPNDPKICAGAVVHLPAQSDLVLYTLNYDPFTQAILIDLQRALSCNQLPAPIDGIVTAELLDLPALSKVGGFLVARPKGFTDVLIVVRISQTEFVATSAVCTHRRCTIGYDAAAALLACPCHGSRYTLAGVVAKGPTTKNLAQYAVVLAGTTLQITVA